MAPPKSNAKRQAEFRARRMDDPDKYGKIKEYWRKKQQDHRRKPKEPLTETDKKELRLAAAKRKREYRAKKKEASTPEPLNSPLIYKNSSSLYRAVSKVASKLPGTPRRATAVVKQLAFKVKLPFTSPLKKKGHTKHALSQETVDTVIAFYNQDDISRWCPGKKEYEMIRDSRGEKLLVQKVSKQHNENTIVSKGVLSPLLGLF